MSKDQAIGGLILAVCVIVAVIYTVTLFYPQWLGTIGLLNANNAAELANARFWVIAIPVFIAFIAILLIGAWIGYTMLTTPPPKPIEEITSEIEENKQEVKPTEEITSSAPVTTAETLKPKENEQQAKETLQYKIVDVETRALEGIGPAYAKKLNENKIYTSTDLLEAGSTPEKRKELSQKTDISGQPLLRWINMADLFRVKGVNEEYADLLEASGVDTVVELSKRIPENLHAKIHQVNAEKNLVQKPPTLSEVNQWVQEAKKLPRKIYY